MLIMNNQTTELEHVARTFFDCTYFSLFLKISWGIAYEAPNEISSGNYCFQTQWKQDSSLKFISYPSAFKMERSNYVFRRTFLSRMMVHIQLMELKLSHAGRVNDES